MEWMKAIGDSIQYIESNITEDITVDDIARHIGVSAFYYQKGFAMLCGFSVSEYIRNRRLALAGAEIIGTDAKIIDIALKYGYDSPDSFTKAFTRFHGCTPIAARRDRAILKSFATLKIKLTLIGGYIMDYRIENKAGFTVIANAKRFPYDGSPSQIPAFWDEHFADGKGDTVSGEYGICLDFATDNGTFEYMIADKYNGKTVPEGFKLYTVPEFTWAVFPCRGAMPNAIQETTGKIYSEWLPSMSEYEIAAGYCVEMYDAPRKYPKGTSDENYYTEVWIPVKKK